MIATKHHRKESLKTNKTMPQNKVYGPQSLIMFTAPTAWEWLQDTKPKYHSKRDGLYIITLKSRRQLALKGKSKIHNRVETVKLEEYFNWQSSNAYEIGNS